MPRAFSFQVLEARYPNAPSLRLLHEVSKRNSSRSAAGNEENLLCSMPGIREPGRSGVASRCPEPVAFPKPILVKGCQEARARCPGLCRLLGRLGKFPFPAALGFGAVPVAGPLLAGALSIALSGSRFEFGSKGRDMKGPGRAPVCLRAG